MLVATLREARDELEACPLGLAPEWGEVHQIHHGDIFPVGGGAQTVPTLFMVGGPVEGCGPMVGDSGSSYMQVTVLGPAAVTSRSVRPIGSSGNPASPHFNDETDRFVKEDPELSYKANPFTEQEVTVDYLESTETLVW
jgi:acyl-homoserine-lactone acylase